MRLLSIAWLLSLLAASLHAGNWNQQDQNQNDQWQQEGQDSWQWGDDAWQWRKNDAAQQGPEQWGNEDSWQQGEEQWDNQDSWQQESGDAWQGGREDCWQQGSEWNNEGPWQQEGEGSWQWGNEGSAGIGIEIESNEYGYQIKSIIEHSPAYEAGLAVGDYIYWVNGNEVEGWSIEQIVDSIRGEAGSYVSLVIRRWGVQQSFEIERCARY